MTRKEEISKAVEEYASRHYFMAEGIKPWDIKPIFADGAEWADAHPDSSWKERLKLEKEEWIDKVCEWLRKKM